MTDEQVTGEALAVLVAVDKGTSPVAMLQSFDMPHRNAVCRRAGELLELRVCAAGESAQSGNAVVCLREGDFLHGISALRPLVEAACKAAGATEGTGEILGMKKSTALLCAAALGVVLLYAVIS